MAGPSTIEQLVLLALFVLPGATFQFVREHSRGPVPGEREIGERILRAFVASFVTVTGLAMVAGSILLRYIEPINGLWFAGAFSKPHQAGALAFVLLVVLPAAVAKVWNRRDERPGAICKRAFAGQSAWDRAFRHRKTGFVRVTASTSIFSTQTLSSSSSRRVKRPHSERSQHEVRRILGEGEGGIQTLVS